MNIIEPKCEIWEPQPGMVGILKHIERVGRVCYKSEDKITEDSHVRFVDMLVNAKHLAMLEHGTIYLTVPKSEEFVINIYNNNPYSRVHCPNGDYAYITTNSRVIIENDWQADLKWMVSEPTKHPRRVTVHFSTQIAISREYNRHRSNSMAEESSRYCNYSKEKFGGEINVSLPSWLSRKDVEIQAAFPEYCYSITYDNNHDWDCIDYWLFANLACEYSYINLIRLGWTPEKARVVLPLDTNTELVHTAFVEDWEHFLDLRCHGKTGKPHPDAQKIAEKLYQKLKALKYIK